MIDCACEVRVLTATLVPDPDSDEACASDVPGGLGVPGPETSLCGVCLSMMPETDCNVVWSTIKNTELSRCDCVCRCAAMGDASVSVLCGWALGGFPDSASSDLFHVPGVELAEESS